MKAKKNSLANIQGKLSRAEMKRISGGYTQTVCTCGHSMETTVCAGNPINCVIAANSYCQGLGYSSINCEVGEGPHK